MEHGFDTSEHAFNTEVLAPYKEFKAIDTNGRVDSENEENERFLIISIEEDIDIIKEKNKVKKEGLSKRLQKRLL
ncbi:hypothetical protein [Psychrosphaera algicola]|uniref:Uncharacterized protein n=1 Tax=Psychrosphaera algicola TaxID=3023714 RepID=A0ABT5FBJ7_9GAMM|nr:hypothetical protein [Psychrosphaera sp. G1-22]MDC2888514.1 hypothetical protein [Psychrosphaera sp. G1-22]